ncbi:MAG: radical SAM family heme chaperone HemW [Victivallales bacterium]|nr:radical SAM family heme chaperone HemW [Victivallales bacterium]
MGIMVREFERLYVHVPFCVRKCLYCGFFSEVLSGDDDVEMYLSCLEREFEAYALRCGEILSVYIGGGTPSSLSADQLGRLFELVRGNFELSRDVEVTVEANPDTLTGEKVGLIWGFAGRVSLGVQSFSCEFCRRIGRDVPEGSAERALEMLCGAEGRGDISCDLIYALPGQGLEDFGEDLEKLVSYPVSHISTYSLTLEEEALLKGDAFSVDERGGNDEDASMMEFCREYLEGRGFLMYEVSNYARPGHESRHNLGVWLGGTYLGCGPSAASFDGVDRWQNVRGLDLWVSGGSPEPDKISADSRAREIFAMGLRTVAGWDRALLVERTGLCWEVLLEELRPLIAEGLMVSDRGRIGCSRKGLMLWNELAERIIL